MKKSLSAILAMLLVGMNLCAFGASSEPKSFENELTYDVEAVDVAPISGKIVVYPNDTSSPRKLASDEYKLSNEGVSESQIKDNTCFRQAFLLVFDSEGKLIEAGANLLANVGGRTNSPQLSVTVPAGGFMVGLHPSRCAKPTIPLWKARCFTTPPCRYAMRYSANTTRRTTE